MTAGLLLGRGVVLVAKGGRGRVFWVSGRSVVLVLGVVVVVLGVVVVVLVVVVVVVLEVVVVEVVVVGESVVSVSLGWSWSSRKGCMVVTSEQSSPVNTQNGEHN